MLKIQMATVDDASLLSSMGYTSYRHHFAPLWKNPSELDAYLEQEYSLPAISSSLAELEPSGLSPLPMHRLALPNTVSATLFIQKGVQGIAT